MFFFFQAEDGIRDIGVTGVQTCALPIWLPNGDLLVVSMKDQRLLRLADGEVTTHADLSGVCGGHVNDMVVEDRKSGVLGKSVDLGGRRIIKKKKKNSSQYSTAEH